MFWPHSSLRFSQTLRVYVHIAQSPDASVGIITCFLSFPVKKTLFIVFTDDYTALARGN